MGSPIKKGSKKNKEVPKQPRVWKNQSPRQTKAWDKQGSWMSEVREWAYTYPWKWGPWNTKDVGQMRSPNKWSPQTNITMSPDEQGPWTKKVLKQMQSTQRTRSPNSWGPQTVEAHQQTITRMNKYIYEYPRGPNSNSGSHTEVIMSRVNKFTRKTISREYTKTSTVQLSPLCLLKLVLITTVLSNLLKS